MNDARVIDFHAHVVHPDVYARTINRNVVTGFGARPAEPHPQPGSPRWENFRKMTEPEAQIADMARRGIDCAVISTSTVSQGTFFAEPAAAAEMDRQANEGIADWVRRHPGKFVGAFTLPLQDLGRALAELEHAVRRLGLRIANLPACVAGAYLGEPRFFPLWEALTGLGVTAFIHPDGIKDAAFQKYSLWNGIGQAIEETRAMASIVYEGVFERFPNVRIVMAHGGGYLPFYVARLDRNASAHPVSMQNIKRPPSEYLKMFWYDTVVYDPAVLEGVARRVGVERIVFGSDYPFGEKEPLALIEKCGFGPEEKRGILGGHAAALIEPRGESSRRNAAE
jgi:aminocarboxymuconate-semialdehyde decarboxylase